MAALSIPSTGTSTAVASSLTTVYTSSGKTRAAVQVNNPTGGDIDLNYNFNGGATMTVTIPSKDTFTVCDEVLPNGATIQLGGSTSLVYKGSAYEVA